MKASRPSVLFTLTIAGLAAIVCSSHVAMAAGANLVPNGTFDRNLSGWTGNVGYCAAFSGVCWSSEDADNSPTSGSASLTAASRLFPVARLTSNCFPVTEAGEYTFSVAGKFAAINYYTGAEAVLSVSEAADCSTLRKRDALSITSGSWRHYSRTITLPAGTVAASVRLGVFVSSFISARAPNRARFDNVSLIKVRSSGSTTTSTAPSSGGTTTTIHVCEGTCGDPVATDTVTPADALYILRAAINVRTCAPCVCDVNSSGNVNTTDALITLSAAVGPPVALVCPQ